MTPETSLPQASQLHSRNGSCASSKQEGPSLFFKEKTPKFNLQQQEKHNSTNYIGSSNQFSGFSMPNFQQESVVENRRSKESNSYWNFIAMKKKTNDRSQLIPGESQDKLGTDRGNS